MWPCAIWKSRTSPKYRAKTQQEQRPAVWYRETCDVPKLVKSKCPGTAVSFTLASPQAGRQVVFACMKKVNHLCKGRLIIRHGWSLRIECSVLPSWTDLTNDGLITGNNGKTQAETFHVYQREPLPHKQRLKHAEQTCESKSLWDGDKNGVGVAADTGSLCSGNKAQFTNFKEHTDGSG